MQALASFGTLNRYLISGQFMQALASYAFLNYYLIVALASHGNWPA